MKKSIFFVICCFAFHKNYAEQFVYPVADFDNGKQLMVVHQKSLDSVELWMWDTASQHAIKGLSSFLIPANLRMMPSGRGFSFIDQGYIKIKEFAKRSPRTLPIYEPIGLFSNMNWINEETFYFVAREGDFFQIFQGDMQANILRLTQESADALYPQKINSTLFYMKRDMDNQTTIICQPWNPVAMAASQDAPQQHITLLKESAQQLCFLRMISEAEGFYLQAPTKKNNTLHDSYDFSCYHLIKNNNDEWSTENIFTFQIPSKYLTGSTRLYESLEPFLPNYNCKNVVYFVTWQHEQNQFQLQKFDIGTKIIESVTTPNLYKNNNQQIFAPYIHHNTMHCGFILPNQERRSPGAILNIFEMDDVQFELSHFEIK